MSPGDLTKFQAFRCNLYLVLACGMCIIAVVLMSEGAASGSLHKMLDAGMAILGMCLMVLCLHWVLSE